MQNKDYVDLDVGAPQPKTNLKTPIIVGVVALFAVIIIVALVLAISSNSANNTGGNNSNETIDIDVTDDFTDAQKMYMTLNGKEITVEYIAKDYLKEFKNNYYINTKEDRTGTITFAGANEYIKFDIINEEDDSPDTAINFAYHETINGEDTFIIQSSENTFQHYNGQVTNEFDKIEDAIMDHRLFQ